MMSPKVSSWAGFTNCAISNLGPREEAKGTARPGRRQKSQGETRKKAKVKRLTKKDVVWVCSELNEFDCLEVHYRDCPRHFSIFLLIFSLYRVMCHVKVPLFRAWHVIWFDKTELNTPCFHKLLVQWMPVCQCLAYIRHNCEVIALPRSSLPYDQCQ